MSEFPAKSSAREGSRVAAKPACSSHSLRIAGMTRSRVTVGRDGKRSILGYSVQFSEAETH
jgi:hypothetical protein